MNSRILHTFCIFSFVINFTFAQETEEIISVASYLESSEQNASPVDVISAEDYKNLRVSTVAELSSILAWPQALIFRPMPWMVLIKECLQSPYEGWIMRLHWS